MKYVNATQGWYSRSNRPILSDLSEAENVEEEAYWIEKNLAKVLNG
jgi:hypothetical protein